MLLTVHQSPYVHTTVHQFHQKPLFVELHFLQLFGILIPPGVRESAEKARTSVPICTFTVCLVVLSILDQSCFFQHVNMLLELVCFQSIFMNKCIVVRTEAFQNVIDMHSDCVYYESVSFPKNGSIWTNQWFYSSVDLKKWLLFQVRADSYSGA